MIIVQIAKWTILNGTVEFEKAVKEGYIVHNKKYDMWELSKPVTE